MRSMRTSWVVSAAAALWMVVFTGSAALAGAYPAAAGAAGSVGGAWRTAHEVHGLAALNAGGDAQILSVVRLRGELLRRRILRERPCLLRGIGRLRGERRRGPDGRGLRDRGAQHGRGLLGHLVVLCLSR